MNTALVSAINTFKNSSVRSHSQIQRHAFHQTLHQKCIWIAIYVNVSFNLFRGVPVIWPSFFNLVKVTKQLSMNQHRLRQSLYIYEVLPCKSGCTRLTQSRYLLVLLKHRKQTQVVRVLSQQPFPLLYGFQFFFVARIGRIQRMSCIKDIFNGEHCHDC